MDWLQNIIITCYGLTVGALCLYGLHRYVILGLYLFHQHRPPKAPVPFQEMPRVTIQLPLYNERHVVQRLLAAVEKLDYPQDRLEIQILDDSTDETRDLTRAEAQRLKQAGFQVYLQQREQRTGYKAGALAEGLQHATGELIYILDADFVPGPDALLKLVHHFTDPEVGMVQSRWGHLNRDFSLLTRIQSIFLDAHFLLEQTARSRSGRFIHFNGTAGMWRRACIEDAGGWEHDTLTEDLDLSLRAQLCGWKFLYLQDVVVPAELPVRMMDFKSQQYRWTKGAIENFKKLFLQVWRSRFSLPIKLEASVQLSCNFAYGFVALLSLFLIPSILMAPEWNWIWKAQMAAFLFATLPVALFFLVAAQRLYPRTWLRDACHLPLILATGVGICVNNTRAILDALFSLRSGFVRTPKFGAAAEQAPGTHPAPIHETTKSPTVLSPHAVMAIESTLTLSFLFSALWAIHKGLWTTVPFVLLFAAGFGFVTWPSLSSWLHERSQSSRQKSA